MPVEVQVDLLIRFLDVASKGLVKPYDPTYILLKLTELKKQGIDVSGVEHCCPAGTEVRDVLDMREYIFLASERICKLMKLF